MDNKCVEKLLETVAFSNGCICSVELIRWEHTHFHPSGSLKPSKEDIALTGRMQKLCMLAGIPVIDHVILGNDQSYFSFREKKILPMEQIQYSVDLNDINLKVAEKEAENYGYEKPHKKSIKESLEENRRKIISGQKTSGVKKKRETTIE